MESPPSSTTWSEAFILSDDSGLLLTNGSVSSGDSRSANRLRLEDSDCSEKSLSQYSLDNMSDIMCGEHYNTLKKVPNWIDVKHIEPPLEFQDHPHLDGFFSSLSNHIICKALEEMRDSYRFRRLRRPHYPTFSPCHRPTSRSSLSSRLSSSHNSLSVPSAHKVDDSSFITQAVSHDTLSSHQISDLYNVPFDSDVYAVPVDVVKPGLKERRPPRRRRRNTDGEKEARKREGLKAAERYHWCLHRDPKRHSVAGSSAPLDSEPIHMTLQEVRTYLQTLYSSSSDSSLPTPPPPPSIIPPKDRKQRKKKDCDSDPKEKRKKVPARLTSLKQTLCNIFKFRKEAKKAEVKKGEEPKKEVPKRALPPLPAQQQEQLLDFATSIQRVKDYGWYWGPLSSEVAEKILSNEPDGSFIVRDSSDDHYIFSLTFKLNNCVRHVRIDHDQGNFSFGSCTKFKSQTIVEFIENAVEHSRSGRYLFFLHRRPVIGPVRVQLLHPVSRFKQVQSLQHICRFAIHKVVRRDLIPSLPLPRRMIDYLNTPHYYSEHLVDVDSTERQTPPPPEPQAPPLHYVVYTNSRQS